METNMKKNVYLCLIEPLCWAAEINIENLSQLTKIHFLKGKKIVGFEYWPKVIFWYKIDIEFEKKVGMKKW